LLYDVSTPCPADPTTREGMTLMTMRSDNAGSRSFDKIRQGFKCPKFSGQCKDWTME
jgi:predicted transcriptional regulator